MYENLNQELLDFLSGSPTCFHVIANIRRMLSESGYTELTEGSSWTLKEGGRYFTVRNESSLIAFRIPTRHFKGFMIAASHSDSPAFKLKTSPEIRTADAYIRLNAEKYGGMLMFPWFDRPLSVAGRLILTDRNGGLSTRLINIDRELLMLPSLAIHMDRTANEGHSLNPQKELLPVYGDASSEGSFFSLIAEEAGVSCEDIAASDLFVYAREKGFFWGAGREFLAAPHLDDLQCSYADLRGFLDSGESSSVSVPLLAIFDNEEVGSGTKQGADGTFLSDTLERINLACGRSPEQLRTAIASSFMVSADNAHAVHPSYPDKADPVNRPEMNKGIVIKHNANQKYTTDAVSAALFHELCRSAGVPVQNFTNRSDMTGGSTLGNISNSHVSLNTVDIGLPQLAMHSPLETAGTKDTAYLVQVMKLFFASSLEDLGSGRYHLQLPGQISSGETV